MKIERLKYLLKSVNIEIAAKVLGFLAVVIYVAGLFCINFYLSQYGLSDYSLLRVRYLLAGTWLAVAFVASGVPPALGW